jgi:hypothetical protein
MDLMFQALPFHCKYSPDLLFCLSGFTATNVDTVLQMVRDVWAHDKNRHHIDDILSTSEIEDESLVYKATWDLIKSVHIEILDSKVTGGLSVPLFNIFATSLIKNTKTWTDLRGFLHLLEYLTELDRCGTTVALYLYPICHSFAHPHSLCPFPDIPLWNGPKAGNKNTISRLHQSGQPRGGRPGCSL